ncbi:hypothetical protein COX00_01445 [Candidatus Uhrbacteria bacterium CG22_combo_CG10-13_8_21_14_all_47_17]|uniref:Uncharacterized protein n=1 Tax=Candidatus Uhrbacteria bacterium CG22_combo_CG10-13_8_21_14_all_47_17 TaxID=1975041 RepID=A0A2H0BSZ5_9BACT|nr:MAG: hypothetical protein COX00_01445 [Candidatus Uhrbacteria bacterium CG22_combo_CG10-13_8_21_14_all_47_17]
MALLSSVIRQFCVLKNAACERYFFYSSNIMSFSIAGFSSRCISRSRRSNSSNSSTISSPSASSSSSSSSDVSSSIFS